HHCILESDIARMAFPRQGDLGRSGRSFWTTAVALLLVLAIGVTLATRVSHLRVSKQTCFTRHHQRLKFKGVERDGSHWADPPSESLGFLLSDAFVTVAPENYHSHSSVADSGIYN